MNLVVCLIGEVAMVDMSSNLRSFEQEPEYQLFYAHGVRKSSFLYYSL